MLYSKFFKPFIDISVAMVLLVALAPIIIIVVVLLGFANQGKVFFYQLRPGYMGKTFKIVKFKTMNDRRDDKGELLPDELRLTKIGKFVRKTSLDELPQLLNVIKGDLSLVGPRPLLIEYLPLYNKKQSRRHLVKPGITGWAQVNGRNAISWEEKFELDIYYVENRTFTLDVMIMFKTIKNVLVAKDINSKTSATMEKFKGSGNS